MSISVLKRRSNEHSVLSRFAISVALLFLIAACGSEGTETTDTEPAGPDTTEAPEDGATTTASTGGEFADVEEAARQEGELVYYSAPFEFITEAEIAAFNELYPEITVTFIRLGSDDMLARFTAERESGSPTADIIKPADSALFVTRPEFFTELSEDSMPNWTNRNASFSSDLYAGVVAGPFVWTYNTDLVESPPVDICELRNVDESLYGTIRLAIPGPGGGWGSWAEVREACGDDFLTWIGERVAAGDIQFYESPSSVVQEVGAGAVSMMAWNQPSHSLELRDAGAPVDFAYIENPSWGLAHFMGINNEAANPNAALVFANFLLSREGNEQSCSGLYRSLLFEDIENCAPVSEDFVLEDVERGLAEGEEIDALLNFQSEESD